MTFETNEPLNELYQRVKAHLSDVLSPRHELSNGFTDSNALTALNRIARSGGIPASLLPQSSIILVDAENSDEQHVYTLLSNNAYTNISHIIAEDARRLPEQDTLSLAYGFATSHPNAIFHLSTAQLSAFSQQVAGLQNEQDLQRLYEALGVRRTAEDFWEVSDTIHQWYRQTYPLAFGYLDYNRLTNW